MDILCASLSLLFRPRARQLILGDSSIFHRAIISVFWPLPPLSVSQSVLRRPPCRMQINVLWKLNGVIGQWSRTCGKSHYGENRNYKFALEHFMHVFPPCKISLIWGKNCFLFSDLMLSTLTFRISSSFGPNKAYRANGENVNLQLQWKGGWARSREISSPASKSPRTISECLIWVKES